MNSRASQNESTRQVSAAPLSPEGAVKTLVVALCLCLLCSFVVASVSVLLKPAQVLNRLRAQENQILKVAGIEGGGNHDETFRRHVTVKWVDLDTGAYVDAGGLRAWDPQSDARSATATILSTGEDTASIKNRGKHAPVYWVKDNQGRFKTLVIPVYGSGLWSLMYGYLGLAADLNTVSGFRIYEHGETPGLGARVSDSNWLQRFNGKQVFDRQGKPVIVVAAVALTKNGIDEKSTASPGKNYSSPVVERHRVDAISGATITSNAVTGMLQFWLGHRGFGPYLQRLRRQAGGGLPRLPGDER